MLNIKIVIVITYPKLYWVQRYKNIGNHRNLYKWKLWILSSGLRSAVE